MTILYHLEFMTINGLMRRKQRQMEDERVGVSSDTICSDLESFPEEGNFYRV